MLPTGAFDMGRCHPWIIKFTCCPCLTPEHAWLACALPAAQQGDPKSSSSLHPAVPPQGSRRLQEQRAVLDLGASATQMPEPQAFLLHYELLQSWPLRVCPNVFLGPGEFSVQHSAQKLCFAAKSVILCASCMHCSNDCGDANLHSETQDWITHDKSFPTILLFWNMGYVCYLAGRLCFFLNVNSGLVVYKIP